jgi:hypothetical protein
MELPPMIVEYIAACEDSVRITVSHVGTIAVQKIDMSGHMSVELTQLLPVAQVTSLRFLN